MLPPRTEEARLLEIAAALPGRSITCSSTGRGQAAYTLASERPDGTARLWYYEAYQAALASEHHSPRENFAIFCSPDWPAEPTDLALVPISTSGEAELTRETLQAAYDSLEIGGHLAAAVDNPKDTWLHDQMKQFDRSVKVRPFDDAIVYFVKKANDLKKRKDFRCELAFKDCDELVRLVTRPGVFSHRRLDNGARQLLDAIDVYPEARLIDIGCGAGSIALAVALREPSAKVLAIDSNARAVDCVEQGIALNSLDNLTVRLDHDGSTVPAEQFDMALGNPPYFADMKIAEHFIGIACKALRSGGRLVLVTKQPKWYRENLENYLGDVEVFESRRYWIASGVKLS